MPVYEKIEYDVETIDRRNGYHQMMYPEQYKDEIWEFVLEARSVQVTYRHCQASETPLLTALSEVAGEPLIAYAWGIAPARYFNSKGAPVTWLTARGNRCRAIGMYHLSPAVREWQLTYQERHTRHQKPVLPITLAIDEARRLIHLPRGQEVYK